MKIERGSFSVGGNGTTTVILNDPTMQVEEVTFFLGAPTGGDTNNRTCDGFMTATQQQARSTFTDATGSKQPVMVNNKCIVHQSRVSGTIQDKVVANKPTNPFATVGEFDVTFTANDSTFPIYFIARGS